MGNRKKQVVCYKGDRTLESPTQLAVLNLGVNLLSGGEPAEATKFLEEAFQGGDETAIQYLLAAYCLTD